MVLLKKGSTGPTVELLQSTLNRLGYNSGTVDGIFGTRTENAVRRFQSAAGLAVDGIVGDKTWAALSPYIDGYIKHTVKAGDTFWNLAKKYGSTVSAIEAANPDVDPQNIQIGHVLIIPLNMSVVPTDVSYGSDLMNRNLNSLKTIYPFLQVGSVGKSVMGLDIPLVCIGKGSNEVFYNASHHANEWITSVLIMKYIENFCKAFVTGSNIANKSARKIFDTTTIYIVPMVNPDGVNLVTGNLDKNSEEYKNAKNIASKFPQIPFPSGWKANIAGVDLNLNYPAEWEKAKKIKFAQGFDKPSPRDYVGCEPFSEPETRALGALTRKHCFTLTLSYHTQGEIIFWKFMDYYVPNSYEIAQEFAAVSGYSVETTPYESGFAGYKDWFIQDFRMPGYTIEAGKGVNPLPISQISEIYRDNVGILTLGATFI